MEQHNTMFGVLMQTKIGVDMSGIIGSKARSSGVVGNINLFDKILQRPLIKDYAEDVYTIASPQTAGFNFDLTNGNVQIATNGANAKNAGITNSLASECVSLTVLMTNGGLAAISWVAGAHGGGGNAVKWAGGSAPTLTASGVDVLTFITFDGGTNFYGFSGGLEFS